MILHLCRVVKIIFFENWIFECLPQKLGSKFFWETLLAPKTSLFLLPPTFSYILLLPSTSSYFFLPISISYFSSTYLLWFGIVYGLVWYGGWRGVISYLVSSYMKRFQCYSAQKSFLGGWVETLQL